MITNGHIAIDHTLQIWFPQIIQRVPCDLPLYLGVPFAICHCILVISESFATVFMAETPICHCIYGLGPAVIQ